MKKVNIRKWLLLLLATGSIAAQAQSTVQIKAINSYNATGAVTPANVNKSGILTELNWLKNRGYATFDLDALPDNAVITAVRLLLSSEGGTVTTTLKNGKITGLKRSSVFTNILFDEVKTGDVFGQFPWHGGAEVAPVEIEFNSAGIAAVQSKIGTFFATGVLPPDSSAGLYYFAGYNSTSTQRPAPTLIITYNPGATQKPKAEFYSNIQTGYLIDTFKFYDNSAYHPANRLWNFGDSTTSTDKNPRHLYAKPGTFSVTLKVSNSTGADSITKTDYITIQENLPAPDADFTADRTIAQPNDIVQFTDLSTNGPTSWQWDFDFDRNPGVYTSTEQNPAQSYTDTARYTVRLIATSKFGTDTIIRHNYIKVVDAFTEPIADFKFVTSGLKVQFTDTSANDPVNWEWKFGDGLTSDVQNPQHTYTDEGVYTVCLKISNPAGADSACRAVQVEKPLGLSDHSAINFEIFPNPSQGEVFINYPDKDAVIELYDLLGRKQDALISFSDSGSWKVELEEPNPDIYLLRLKKGSSLETVKILFRK